jgi:hypothetical protein
LPRNATATARSTPRQCDDMDSRRYIARATNGTVCERRRVRII